MAKVTSDLNSETPLVPGDAERRAQTAAILAEVFAPDTTERTSQVEALRGVRIVYIHYDAKKDKALEVKETLTEAAVSAPPVRPARGIRKNDIRYPGPQAFEAVALRAKPLCLLLLKNVAVDWAAFDCRLPKIVHLIH